MLCNLNTSDMTALLSAIAAAFSAWYACQTWSEAKRSNEINLSTPKKTIFDAFFSLRMHMLEQQKNASLEVVSKFYYPSRDAVIYYPKDMAKKISEYYQACLAVADLACVGSHSAEEKKTINAQISLANSLGAEIETEMQKAMPSLSRNG